MKKLFLPYTALVVLFATCATRDHKAGYFHDFESFGSHNWNAFTNALRVLPPR